MKQLKHGYAWINRSELSNVFRRFVESCKVGRLNHVSQVLRQQSNPDLLGNSLIEEEKWQKAGEHAYR
jgi:hypothetical protein